MKRLRNRIIICLLTAVCLLQQTEGIYAEEARENRKGCVVSIALDVSGSMIKTDPERNSIELIKMFLDLCGEEDYINVTTYNDEIVYKSGLLRAGDTSELAKLKQELEAVAFAGETDNGLGLKTAVQAAAEKAPFCERSFVVLITDGNTDLSNSNTGRTEADSNADMDESSRLAREQGIMLNAVEYTDVYSKDTSLLSVVTAQTGGTANMVNNPVQFIQVMISTFFTGYNGGTADLTVSENAELINRSEFPLINDDETQNYALIYATQPILDFELTGDNGQLPYILGGRYAVIKTDSKAADSVTALYSFLEPATVASGTVSAPVAKLEEPQALQPEPETPSFPPAGTAKTQQVYASKGGYQFDISSMFSDPDGDIVSYQINGASGPIPVGELLGSMFSADITEAGTFTCEITATDSRGNQGSAELTLLVLPAWKRYYGWVVGGIIVVILAAAAAACILIVKKLLYRGEPQQPGIHGILEAKFIDIKSKNESVDMRWDLSDYPPEGVSLKELFHSIQISEDLKDLDRICFYPSKNRNELLLVHCMEGGVFIGEHLARPNTPVKLRAGDVIYLSFAENASEIELMYGPAGS